MRIILILILGLNLIGCAKDDGGSADTSGEPTFSEPWEKERYDLCIAAGYVTEEDLAICIYSPTEDMP